MMPPPVGPLSRQRLEAQKLGQKAFLSASASLAACGLSFFLLPLPFTFLVACGGLLYTGLQTWRWFAYRASWGLRF